MGAPPALVLQGPHLISGLSQPLSEVCLTPPPTFPHSLANYGTPSTFYSETFKTHRKVEETVTGALIPTAQILPLTLHRVVFSLMYPSVQQFV